MSSNARNAINPDVTKRPVLDEFLTLFPATIELSVCAILLATVVGVTVGVLAFVASWNAYLLPLLLLQGDMKTLPLGVADFSSQYSSDTAGVFAFTTLAMIPALVFFLAMQRRIVNGLQGAVKG